MPTRREFLKWTAASGAGLAVGGLSTGYPQTARAARTRSAAGRLTPYLDPMPILAENAIDATAGTTVHLSANVITRQVHSQLPATTLFGYEGGPNDGTSYLGPVVLAQSGTPVTAHYTNQLAPSDYVKVFTNNGSSYAQFNPFTPPEARILTHLHGGLLTGDSDGNPYASPDAFASGQTQTATYPNAGVNADGSPYVHPASLLWCHDHLLGDTRMNVVAGLAGAYLLRDRFDTGSNTLLPGPIGMYELPLVVQDRQFNVDGSLLYPVAPPELNGPWIGEYFGDVMLVNGKIWPTLQVEPAVYRFRVLNGCNARILSLRIVRANDRAVPTYIIGAEGGLLPAGSPVATHRLVMAPAERFDVICDFRGRRSDALHQEHQAAEAGLHAGTGIGERHADHRETDGLRWRADDRPTGRVVAVPAGDERGDRPDQPGTAAPQRRDGHRAGNHPERDRRRDDELGAEPQRKPLRRPR